jgi:hypothetical protein
MASPAENFAALSLAQPSHVAKQSGSWFDPNTWQGGVVPGDNAKVVVAAGTVVTYDNKSNARLSALEIKGQLKFATQTDTKMVVDTAFVAAGGRLEIGTQGNPVLANAEVLIANNGPLNLSADPQQLGRGLVSVGQVEIHGLAKVSHLKVAVDPRVGDRTLTLQGSPTNWQVGDRLVLTGTRFISQTNGQAWDSLTQDEEVTIQAIEGNRITLNQALRYDHSTPRGDLKAYVANQSRNVVIATENGEGLPLAQRGHTMFSGNDKIDIRYAEFKDLGRTDKTRPVDTFQATGDKYPRRVLDAQGNPLPGNRTNMAGRYAAHIHHAGSGNPAVMVGNVVDDSPGLGFVVHDSRAILEENVAYDVSGGAFVTETGNEVGAFRNNIAIKTGPGSDNYNEKQGVGVHDFARSGVGFWFQGRLFENEGNVAAGSREAGMFYMHRGVDLIPVNINDLPVPSLAKNSLSANTVSVEQPAIQGFKNNEVFASGAGLKVIKDFPQQNHDLRTVMDGFKGWEVEKGTEFQYTSHYTMKNFDLIGSQSFRPWENQGLLLQRNTQDMVFTNMRAAGFSKGISVQLPDSEGPAALADRGLVWVDLQLANNKENFENFSLPPEKWLKQSDLATGRLEFTPSSDIDLVANTSESVNYIDIRGVKTDSLGPIAVPFGDDRISYNYNDVLRLASKGHYRFPDGSRGAVIEEYFSDRVTGETKKYSFAVTLQGDWWTQNSPYLGELNPSQLPGPTPVGVPQSRFRLPGRTISPVAPRSSLVASVEADSSAVAQPPKEIAPVESGLGSDAFGPDAFGPDAFGPDAFGPNGFGSDGLLSREAVFPEGGINGLSAEPLPMPVGTETVALSLPESAVMPLEGFALGRSSELEGDNSENVAAPLLAGVTANPVQAVDAIAL